MPLPKTSATLQPIALYGDRGVNPPKVSIVLEELNIPYTTIAKDFTDVKKPDFLAINPNGRVPAIVDPNTGLTLWESGAIVEYIVDQYDTERKLSFEPGTPEFFHAKQWLHFQVSGQGPYYGQAIWFKTYHPEKVPSAVERYVKEINRVTGTLDSYLAEKEKRGETGVDGPWLVGDKMSYADLAFLPWQNAVFSRLEKNELNREDYPHLAKWEKKMTERPAVRKVFDPLGW